MAQGASRFDPPGGATAGEPPRIRDRFRDVLGSYGPARLQAILTALGRPPIGGRVRRPADLAEAVADRLEEPGAVEIIRAGLDPAAEQALGLLALTEEESWPAWGLVHCLRCLGIEPRPVLERLLDLGLVVAQAGAGGVPVPILDADQLFGLLDRSAGDVELVAHPSASAGARLAPPDSAALRRAGPVRQVREADGLEPILRLAALWQRVAEEPLRQTQQGSLYKRDRDRLEDDPALNGPIADTLWPLPEQVMSWLGLAVSLGLVRHEPGGDRILAAPAEFWAEHAVHLPQMVATHWLGLAARHSRMGGDGDSSSGEGSSASAAARPAILLWLAGLAADSEWVALEDLAAHLDAIQPGWDRLEGPGGPMSGPSGADAGPPHSEPGKSRRGRPRAGSPARGREPGGADTSGLETLEAMLLGSAYAMGLVRAAEEVGAGRRVVQLSRLGRYALALGPPPPPRPDFEQFVYVQPNFEVIAYRQGLNPILIGQLSRFARWHRLGAALELKLTPESVYRGLESGLSTEQMRDWLGRHSARPLPAGVAEALRAWSQRRDRLTLYTSAILLEFTSEEDLAAALADWPAPAGGHAGPSRVAGRFLLVEDEASIPFHRFRQIGARDYRRPPEPCVAIEPDGITLALDLSRSDLLMDAELARFADELPPPSSRGGPALGGSRPAGLPRRRYRVSPESLARAWDNGLTPALLLRWFPQRTGSEASPALHLLLYATGSQLEPLQSARRLVLTTPTAALLDGLVQHPATRPLLGERLGPSAIVVPDAALPSLQRALAELGLMLDPPRER